MSTAFQYVNAPDKRDPLQEGDDPDGQLPPRIIVELPNGEVVIGEDEARLQEELTEARQAREHQQIVNAQPGTENWVESRRLIYATTLEAVLLTRKRATTVLLGVDIVYMIMTIISIVFGNGSWSGNRDLRQVAVILGQSAAGLTLDAVSIAFVVKDAWRAHRYLLAAHGLLFIAGCVLSFSVVIIIRILVLFLYARLLAAYLERNTIVSGGLPSRRFAWLRSGLLGAQVTSLSTEYVAAVEAAREAREGEVRGEAGGSLQRGAGADGSRGRGDVHVVVAAGSGEQGPASPERGTAPARVMQELHDWRGVEAVPGQVGSGAVQAGLRPA